MYESVGRNKNNHSNQNTVKNSAGVLQIEQEVRARWKEYIEVLYDKQGKPEDEEIPLEREEQVDENNIGPELLKDEIEKAVRQLKKEK